jgi:lysozyme family protein
MGFFQDFAEAIGLGPAAQPTEAAPADNFPPCVTVTLSYEGGFADDPSDPGGATNFGITARTLAHYLGRDVTTADIQAMSQSTAMAIYRTTYWNAMCCGELPPGVDLSVFDFGVNSGTSTAIKALQGQIGVTQDGVIGPVTLGAVAGVAPMTLVNGLALARLAYLRGLSTFVTFGDGWTARVNGVQAHAQAMADA